MERKEKNLLTSDAEQSAFESVLGSREAHGFSEIANVAMVVTLDRKIFKLQDSCFQSMVALWL